MRYVYLYTHMYTRMRNASYNLKGTLLIICPKSFRYRTVLQLARFIIVVVIPMKTSTCLSCTSFSLIQER